MGPSLNPFRWGLFGAARRKVRRAPGSKPFRPHQPADGPISQGSRWNISVPLQPKCSSRPFIGRADQDAPHIRGAQRPLCSTELLDRLPSQLALGFGPSTRGSFTSFGAERRSRRRPAISFANPRLFVVAPREYP